MPALMAVGGGWCGSCDRRRTRRHVATLIVDPNDTPVGAHLCQQVGNPCLPPLRQAERMAADGWGVKRNPDRGLIVAASASISVRAALPCLTAALRGSAAGWALLRPLKEWSIHESRGASLDSFRPDTRTPEGHDAHLIGGRSRWTRSGLTPASPSSASSSARTSGRSRWTRSGLKQVEVLWAWFAVTPRSLSLDSFRPDTTTCRGGHPPTPATGGRSRWIRSGLTPEQARMGRSETVAVALAGFVPA
jgi:hypothetical protein